MENTQETKSKSTGHRSNRMGHTVNAGREYRLLQQRLDAQLTGGEGGSIVLSENAESIASAASLA